MFSRRDYSVFAAAIILIVTACVGMAIDSTPNGFGVLTLWIAPPLLIIGFALPVVGILGRHPFQPHSLNLKTAKHISGFMVWLISLAVYTLTLEPTASLWDCSEFIACAYKLQVPHTPGTPLSLLIARIFTMFSPDAQSVAGLINFFSAFFSAGTVWLVYLLTYHFGQQLARHNRNSPGAVHADSRKIVPRYVIIFSSALASLTLTFSDTFWFSAVEAETYGIACFFLLLLVLLIVKGRNLSGNTRSRRLVLIAYLGGLSYCIHPMCVLALGLLPFCWYPKNVNVPAIRQVGLLLTGLVLVFLINRFVAIGIFQFAFRADKFFVNAIGLPFYSGAILFAIVLSAGTVAILRKMPVIRNALWPLIFLVLGFAPYATLFIRSQHNPPIDETNPEDLPMIKAYMNRESYPTSPLVYGPYFDANVEGVEAGREVFHKGAGKYELSGTVPEYRFERKRSTIFPRLYSNDEDHINAYREWLGLTPGEKPTYSDNISFLITYQLGHMYFRYLMFNFAGRESDHQNAGWLRPWDTNGSASPFTSKARNQYWMLPLLAGLAGAAFQWRTDRRNFTVLLSLFFITGLVLALYLNSPPIEPRERDYIYVASFIVFCIWIGLSLIAVTSLVRDHALAIPLVFILTMGIPALMAWQNYDDHDRSGRSFQVDNARNLLASCAPNAILFTGGDNDTFPLWYVQEVEGFRTDIRVVVLSYLNTDWYINQLRNSYYESKPFALSLSPSDYQQYGPNDVLYLQESIKEGIDAKRYLQLIHAGNPALRAQSSTGDYFTILPSRKLLILRGDTTALPANQADDSSHHDLSFRSHLGLDVNGNYATKSVLAILDVLVSNQWKRPVYFNFTSLNTAGLDLNGHVVQEGNVYRFDPMRAAGGDILVDRRAMYENLMVKGEYSNLGRPDVNFNYEDYVLRIISPLRQSFNTLAFSYLNNKEPDTALAVLAFAKDKLYPSHLHPTLSNLDAAELFSALGDDASAVALCSSLFECHFEGLRWQLENGKTIQPLDLYLARQAASLLTRLGDGTAQDRLQQLDLKQ